MTSIVRTWNQHRIGVRDAYEALHDALMDYLDAIEEWKFRTVFEFALDYAARAEKKKAV